MYASINCAGLHGIEGYPVSVETTAAPGLPSFILTGALSQETKEAQFRVRSAILSSGYDLPPARITSNLSPADLRKDGTAYDLAIAVSVLCAFYSGNTEQFRDCAFFGELGLDGSLRPVRGILPLCFAAKEAGIKNVFVPEGNVPEAALVPELAVCGAVSLNDAVSLLFSGPDRMQSACRLLSPACVSGRERSEDPDFSDIRGQEYMKRAAEIAVCGRHNILFSGPAGTGKTMIARRMPSIMPELTREEDIEISKIYSICGLLNSRKPLLGVRPFRAPHHGISMAAFTGGGANVLPGELSLASSGILFLDELPLFPQQVLESLRQPMEERKITVSRMKGSYTYPADFQLVAAMNNCACGFYPDRKKCTCTPAQIRAYNGHLSKPLLERIDICAEARPVGAEELICTGRGSAAPAESSARIRERVIRAQKIQSERFASVPSVRCNSGMGVRELELYCRLGKAEELYMKEIYQNKGLSGRTYHKILKVARTIADMDGCGNLEKEHLAEAVGLRSIEDSLFQNSRSGR